MEDVLKGPEKTDRKRGSKSRRTMDYAKAEARREADELFNRQMNLNKEQQSIREAYLSANSKANIRHGMSEAKELSMLRE